MKRRILAVLLAMWAPAGAQRPGAGFCPRNTALPNHALHLDHAVVTADLPASLASCSEPAPMMRLTADVSAVSFWFLVRNVRSGDQPRVEWISPDGNLFTYSVWQPLMAEGDFCYHSTLTAASLASRAGTWKARLVYNLQVQATRAFEVPSPALEHAQITTQPPDGCTFAEPVALLGSLPDSVYVWTRFAAAPPPRLRYEWLDSDANVLATQTVVDAGGRCIAAQFRLASAARPPGEYSVRVVGNDQVLTTLSFSTAPAEVDEIRMLQRYPEGCRADPDSPAYASVSDSQTITWVRLRTGGQSGLLVFDYFDPDGERVTSAGATLNPTTESQCIYGVTPLRPELSRQFTGDWKVRLSLDGYPLGEKAFNVGPVLLGPATATRAVSGCALPVITRSYLNSEPRALVWFQVRGAQPGQRPALDWIGPDGAAAGGVEFAPVADAGDFCYAAELPLDGLESGFWRAGIRWQGQFLTSRRFFTGIARLEDIRLAQTHRGCEPPVAQSRFLATDPQALLWFKVEDSGSSDNTVIEWLSPDGTIARTESWNVLAPGSYYFTSKLPLAGTQPRGAWTARVRWNGAILYDMAFTVD